VLKCSEIKSIINQVFVILTQPKLKLVLHPQLILNYKMYRTVSLFNQPTSRLTRFLSSAGVDITIPQCNTSRKYATIRNPKLLSQALESEGIYKLFPKYSVNCKGKQYNFNESQRKSSTTTSGKDTTTGAVEPPPEVAPAPAPEQPKTRPKRALTSTERNFITPVRAMQDFLLQTTDLAGLRKTMRRSPHADEPPISVYWRRDVEQRWGLNIKSFFDFC
jgi:hypothetical protein